MSDEDAAPVIAPARHLRVVRDDEPGAGGPLPPGPFSRGRRLRGRRNPVEKLISDVEVPITGSTDLAVNAVAEQTERVDVGAAVPLSQHASDSERCERLALICQKIAEGNYDSDEILGVVARRIVERGEVGEEQVFR